MQQGSLTARRACALASLFTAQAGASVQFYIASDTQSRLYTGSLSDGVAMSVGPLGLNANTTAGMDFTPDGRLIAVDQLPFPGAIHEVGLGGGSTLLHNLFAPGVFVFEGIAFGAPGEAYLWGDVLGGNDVLLTVDLGTGLTSSQVTVDFGTGGVTNMIAGATTVRDDGMLMMIARSGELVEVDPLTGAASVIGNTAIPEWVRGASTYNGITYVLDNAGMVYEVDLYDAQTSALVQVSGYNGTVFNFAVIPAPGTGIALCGLGVLATRRRR